MGGNTEKTTQVQTNDPWSGQMPYLSNAFSEAQGIYNTNKTQNTQPYSGDFYAKPTDQMVSAFQGALGWGSGTGQNAATTAAGLGTQNATAGTAGAQGAMGGLFDAAKADSTASNITAASQYADNPYMDSMVDASMRDARRQVSEQAIPGLNREAAATGNMNSSRTGVAEGVLARGLAEKTADVSAGLRGQAYQSGISQAQQDTAAKIGALTGAGGLAGGMTNTGMAGLASSVDMNKTNTDNALTATTMLNGFDQQKIDNELAKYDYQQQLPWQNLANYWNIVGDKSWGGTQTSTGSKTSTPSTVSSLGMGLGVLGSLFKCDIRTKTDIEYFMTRQDGIRLYSFTYKDDPEKKLHIGPMAQEVEEKYPEAIVEVDGIKHIDTNIYDWR